MSIALVGDFSTAIVLSHSGARTAQLFSHTDVRRNFYLGGHRNVLIEVLDEKVL